MNEIEKLINKLQNEESKTSREVSVETWKLIAAGISIFGGVLAIILILMRELPFFEDGKNNLLRTDMIVMIIFVIVVAFISILIISLTGRSIINKLSSRHLNIITVLESFNTIENSFANYVPEIKKISTNLKRAPVSDIITWEESREMEVDALYVWSFSYSLWWLTENEFKRVNDILDELRENNDHEYHYILYDPENKQEQTIRDIRRKIDMYDRVYNCKIADRFILKRITESEYFPLPNDIVICQTYGFETKEEKKGEKKAKDAVVVNTKREPKFYEDKRGFNENEKNQGYDFVFRHKEQVERVIDWYADLWKKLPDNK